MTPRGRWPAALLVTFLLGAAPPDVVKVRVPGDKVQAWFPPGTEIRCMPSDEFDRLLRAARAGAARRDGATGPRLLRASHEARWDDGVLIGRSELVIEPGDSGSYLLEPWTPAIETSAKEPALVRADDAGRAEVRVEKAKEPVSVHLSWRLRARPGSAGRRFSLGLPGDDSCSLRLDLPEGMIPDGVPGLRLGPEPLETSKRAGWRFVGKIGASELSLHRVGRNADEPAATRLWVEGPTRVELGDAGADWSTRWLVGETSPGDRTLELLLDAGLDLTGASGSDVEGYQAEPIADGSTRVSVRLRAPSRRGPSEVTIRARCNVPLEGRWAVPSVQPLNAAWTGGKTTIRLDPMRAIDAVRPLAGREAAGRALAEGPERILVFEAERPSSVAELVFRRPDADLSARVQGRLVVGNAAPRLTARIAWRADRVPPHDLAVDLPASWLVDRVAFEGTDGPASWHAEDLPGGASRVHAAPPSGDWLGKALTMVLSAGATVAGGRGPLAIPRIRPVGARLGDDAWTATTEDGLSLAPIQARGLAWIDPEPAAIETNPSLAWRWIRDDAEGRLDRVRPDTAARTSVHLTAVVAADRLAIQAALSLDARTEPIRSLVLALSEPVPTPSACRLVEKASGLELPLRPLSSHEREKSNPGGDGPAWSVQLPTPARGRLALAFMYEVPWPGKGRIPLLLIPGETRARGTALVLAGREVRSTIAGAGVTSIDPDLTAESFLGDGAAEGEKPRADRSDGLRRAYAFLYEDPKAWVELETESLASIPNPGVIREALLTTLLDARGPRVQKLRLEVVLDRASTLDVDLPPGSRLERVLVDGRTVAPLSGATTAESLSIPLRARADDPASSARTVILDYLTPGGEPSDVMTVRPARPKFSMPCLGLTWEVAAPPAWQISGWGKTLTPEDSFARRTPLEDRLAGGRFAWSWPFGRKRRPAAATTSAIGPVPRSGETRLDELLTKWDAGESPVIVDRTAVRAAGWGPLSRASDAFASDVAGKASEAIGLKVVSVGPFSLVTTSEASPIHPDRPALESALRSAAAWGSDSADRYQSVARWREEPNPVRADAGGGESGSIPPGRVVRRFIASGWPDSGVEVTLIDQHGQTAWAWAVGCGVLAAGLVLSGKGLPLRTQAASSAGLVGVGLLATVLAPPLYRGAAAGLFGSAVGLAFFGLGRTLPRLVPSPIARRFPRQVSTITHRRSPSGFTVITPAILAFLGLAAATYGAFGQMAADGDAGPILALLPYEGATSPAKEPGRVLLRLKDYHQLTSLAANAEVSSRPNRLLAASAIHRVRWVDKRDVLVETELVLVPEGPGLLRWSFPVEESKDIEAVLDGEKVPVHIEAGGRVGSIQIEAHDSSRSGRGFLLRLRRKAAAIRGERGESIALPINVVPSARFEVEPHPQGLRLEAPTARGRVDVSSKKAAGRLGPVGRLELNWLPDKFEEQPTASGRVEGVYLWDALAAGDRVRAKLTYHGPRSTAAVRVGLGPGVMVRSWSIPGAGHVDVSWEGSAETPTWVARIDPPLPDGGSLVLEAWRPRGSGDLSGDDPDDRPRRVVPTLDPLGVERVTGVLGFRRPLDWNGRLAPRTGSEAVGDEMFLREWGSLPPEPLALSGAIRMASAFGRAPLPEVATSPVPARYSVAAKVQATASPGRLDVAVDAELSDPSGAVHEAEAVFPSGFRVVRVEGDGLTDWMDRRVSPSGVRLRFDGPTARTRRVRIQGWLPVPCDPLSSSRGPRECAVPWPRWPGQEEKPGLLTVASPSRSPLEAGSKAEIVSVESQGLNPGSPVRVTYRMSGAEASASGRLIWEDEPPRVTVRLQSALMIDAESAEWLAALQYDVSGGPLDAINLRLPVDWAKNATVQLDGVNHQRVTETRGEYIFWSIRPERPIWGSKRLLLRSSLPLPRGETKAFPDLSPLGRGGVETNLRVVNQGGKPLHIDASSGVEPVPVSSLPSEPELDAAALPAAATTAYHVVRPGWSLRISRPSEAAGERRASAKRPLADQVEITCTRAADGSTEGVAGCVVEPRSGGFLPVRLDAGLPIWASVNGNPARILRAGPGRWLVPLAEESVSRVKIIWRGDSLIHGDVVPPILGASSTPAVLTIRTPPGMDASSPPGGLPAAYPERLDIERARWSLLRAIDGLTGFDRNARGQGEALVALIVRCELHMRQAERGAAWDPSATVAERASRANQIQAVIRLLRRRLSAAVHEAGLGEYEDAARTRLGQDLSPNANVNVNAIAVLPESAGDVSLRPLGVPHSFLGDLTAERASIRIAGDPATDSGAAERPWLIGLVLTALLLPGLTFVSARRGVGGRWSGRAALLFGLGLLAAWCGPWCLAGGTGAALLGRIVRR